jgi:hypothetical protein
VDELWTVDSISKGLNTITMRLLKKEDQANYASEDFTTQIIMHYRYKGACHQLIGQILPVILLFRLLAIRVAIVRESL